MPATAPTPSLDADDLATWEEKGYWVSPPLVDADRVGRLRDAHEMIWSGGSDTPSAFPCVPPQVKESYEPHALRKLDNGWWLSDAVRDLVTDGLLGRLAAQLLGCEKVRLWHDQVILKPPAGPDGGAGADGGAGSGGGVGNVGWHQDCGYWKAADTTNMLTIWLALQDTDLENGGMRSIAGSHRWGLVEGSDSFFEGDLDGLKKKYEHLGAWADEPCLLASGAASFHHGLTFHGSGPNQTDRPRLSVVAHVMPDGTAWSGSDSYHRNVNLLGPRPQPGDRFDNAFFPFLNG